MMISGCSKNKETVSFTLERVGGITYESVQDIVDSYTQDYVNSTNRDKNAYFLSDPDVIQRGLDYDKNSTMRIGFFYKFKPLEEYAPAVIDLCENGIRQNMPSTRLNQYGRV